MLAKIQMRRGTSTEWAAAAPVILSAGEPGYDTTEKKMKVGDGATEWAGLDFLGASDCPYDVGDILTTINEASPAARWPGTVWAAMAPGRVLVGVDPADVDFDAVGKQGGSKNQNHGLSAGYAKIDLYGQFVVEEEKQTPTWNTTHEMPTPSTDYASVAPKTTATALGGTTDTASTLPPYETVYRYKRTA